MTKSASTFTTPEAGAESAKRLHVAASTVVIFSLLFSPAALVAGLLAWRGQQMIESATLALVYFLGLYWVCGRTVELAPGRLVYRVFFSRRRIDVTRVQAVRVVAEPAPALELMQRGSSEFVAAFYVKAFTRSGVAAILQHVLACSPNAELDAITLEMAHGRFESRRGGRPKSL